MDYVLKPLKLDQLQRTMERVERVQRARCGRSTFSGRNQEADARFSTTRIGTARASALGARQPGDYTHQVPVQVMLFFIPMKSTPVCKPHRPNT